MPDPTPIPVKIVGLADSLWEYGDKAEEFSRLALAFGALSVALVLFLLTALLVASGLARRV